MTSCGNSPRCRRGRRRDIDLGARDGAGRRLSSTRRRANRLEPAPLCADRSPRDDRRARRCCRSGSAGSPPIPTMPQLQQSQRRIADAARSRAAGRAARAARPSKSWRARKQTMPSAVMVLEELSGLLPDQPLCDRAEDRGRQAPDHGSDQRRPVADPDPGAVAAFRQRSLLRTDDARRQRGGRALPHREQDQAAIGPGT